METKDNSKDQRRWVREEVCLLVAEYYRTKALTNEDIERSHEFVSRVLRNREKSLTVERRILSGTDDRDFEDIAA